MQLTSDGLVPIIAFGSVAALVILLTSCMYVVLARLAMSERRAATIARKSQHWVRSSLTLAQIIAQQTFRSSEPLAQAQAAFSARLAAIGRAHDVIGEAPDKDVGLEPLIAAALGPFELQRFSLSGPSVQLDSEIAIAAALLIHELASNALSYGALSNPAGRIEISWTSARPTRQLTLTWKERFGPPVSPPFRVGYGSKLLRAAFAKEDGAASLTFEPDGVRCTATFPILGV